MQVSMNGLRNSLISDYNQLTEKLNASIKDKSHDPHIVISPEYIQRHMDGLRSAIVTLAFCYIEGEDGFDALHENTFFEQFNNTDEEDN